VKLRILLTKVAIYVTKFAISAEGKLLLLDINFAHTHTHARAIQQKVPLFISS